MFTSLLTNVFVLLNLDRKLCFKQYCKQGLAVKYKRYFSCLLIRYIKCEILNKMYKVWPYKKAILQFSSYNRKKIMR